jgi:probable rRNA maturation factor
MADYEIDIQIDERFRRAVRKTPLRRAAQETLRAEGVEAPAEVGLVITDDEQIRGLNRRYLHRNRVTDVLAFSLREGEFVPLPNGILHLGEVIISCPQARRQARDWGHTLEEELALLVVHGVLHLLGYDDEEPEPEQRMRQREQEILKSLG